MMNPHTSAQDVMRCDLCETALVQMHCDTCLVNLCKACVGEHISTDESKDHKVVKFQSRKTTPLYPGCKTHDKQQCTMYCNHCDIPVCNTCIASDQHKGHKFLTILQVLDEKKNKIIKEQTELKDTIYPTYQDIASDVQNRMSQLEKECGDLSTAITKHGEDWHREINELVMKRKAEVDEMKNTQLQSLKKHLDEINKKISGIKDEIFSLNVTIGSNDISKLFDVKFNIDRLKELPQKNLPFLPKFTPGRIQEEELGKLFGVLSSGSLTADKQGYSMKTSPETYSSPVRQLLDEPEIVTTIDTGCHEYLVNMACQNDEEIWTRGIESTMELFSISQRSLLKSIRTKSGNKSEDMAVTKSGDLVYSDHKDRTVNIVKNEKIEEVIRLKNWKPLGVCSTSSGDLLVIMNSTDNTQSRVVRYSGSTEKQTIQFDGKGKPLYYHCDVKYLAKNKNLDICVSDTGAKAVVVVNHAGKLRFRYTGHTPTPKNKPFSPRGITTDSQSHILTSDYNNDCIHIVHQDGQFLSYIDCGLRRPWGLCIDTKDNLFVGQFGNKQVKKIKYLQ